MDLEILGAKQLYELGGRLKAAPKPLRSRLTRGLNKAAKPLMESVREQIPLYMPGGYEQALSRSLRTRVKTHTGYYAWISILATADGPHRKRDIVALDKGVLRHPVYGRYRRLRKGANRGRYIANPWVAQAIPPGFFRQPMREGAIPVRRQMMTVIRDFTKDLASTQMKNVR